MGYVTTQRAVRRSDSDSGREAVSRSFSTTTAAGPGGCLLWLWPVCFWGPYPSTVLWWGGGSRLPLLDSVNPCCCFEATFLPEGQSEFLTK